MEARSNRSIENITKLNHQNGEYQDLLCCIKTKERWKLKFSPAVGGLRTLEVDQKTDGCIFGAEINDNITDSRSAMRYTGLGISSGEEKISYA